MRILAYAAQLFAARVADCALAPARRWVLGDRPLRYASLMTSRGCPFECEFCHISKEGTDSESGYIRQLRLKSDARVMQEIDRLKDLGVEYVFMEDESLLVKKGARCASSTRSGGVISH